MFKFLLILAFVPISVNGAGAAPSGSAPSGLKGKSVILRWTESRIQRLVGEPAFRPFNVTLEMSVYVSTQGRVFNRMQSNSGASGQVAGQGGSGPKRIPSFEGRSMTIMQPLQGLARRIAVDFDASFASCTASVIFGKETGATSGFMRAFGTKALQEIQSVTVSGTSCSVREGNVFQ
jgi:hypothetical protein